MSFWQFQACADGYAQAHSTGEESVEPMTEDEFDRMIMDNVDWIASGMRPN